MKSLLTRLSEHAGDKLCHRYNNTVIEHTTEPLDEGMSITDFNKMMSKFKKSGINFNRMSAQQLMYTLYNTMDKHDFKMLDDKIQQATDELKKTPTSCGGRWDDEDSCGRSRRSSRHSSESCGSSHSHC